MFREICIFASAAILLVEGIPNCQFTDVHTIKCTPGNEDYVIRRGLVSEHDVVTHITLRACRITEVEYEAFHLLPALEYLDLSENKIKTFKMGVMDGFNQLKFLNLSWNQISDFPPGLLDSKHNLEVLDLKGNRLANIPVGTLYPMPKLKHLDISSNSYLGRHLNPDAFNLTPKISFMDFSRNDMSDSPDNLLSSFTAIDFLNLDRCSLRTVPAFAVKSNLKTMRTLYLSSNSITNISDPSTFSNLEDLEFLNLHSNLIEYIHNYAFSQLRKLKVVILINNKLKYIPDALFRNLPMLTDVDLSRNSLEVLPVNAFRGSPLKNLVISDNKLTFLDSNFCLELRNSGGKLTEFRIHNNPWQCACLRDILLEMKQYDITYKTDDYEGQARVCVTTTTFNCERQESVIEFYKALYTTSDMS